MIPDLHATFTDLKLYVREDYSEALPRGLEQGRHDVCVIPLPVNRGEIVGTPIFREPIYLAMAADHPLALKRKIDRRDLRGHSILTLEPGHQLREQVETICKDVGANMLTDYEGTSLDTLREMVGMNMGLSFLPGLYVRSILGQVGSVKTVELSGPPISRTIGLIWRKSSARTEEFLSLTEEFRNAIRREFPDFTVLT
jgi:LysR family hydrogen peroxide-inducible transcriptional activator